MPAPRACLAVLSYDGRELLGLCLPSVVGQEHPDFEVVVVDNGSSDGTAAWLREAWPQVRVVALPANVGVTAALNELVRAAGEARFVALLNNDVELAPDWLSTLEATLEAHPEAAAAAGKLLQYDDRDRLDRAGDVLHRSSAAFGRGAGEVDHGQFDTAGEVFAVGGAAALFRADALRDVGPFDERYFAYLEDVDWGVRARLRGWTARYEPRALGFHKGGATLGELSPFTLYHLRRNQLWLVLKAFPARTLLRSTPRIAAFNAHQVAMAMRRGRLGLVARAYRDAVRGLPAVLRERRAVQRGRRLSAADFEALLP